MLVLTLVLLHRPWRPRIDSSSWPLRLTEAERKYHQFELLDGAARAAIGKKAADPMAMGLVS